MSPATVSGEEANDATKGTEVSAEDPGQPKKVLTGQEAYEVLKKTAEKSASAAPATETKVIVSGPRKFTDSLLIEMQKLDVYEGYEKRAREHMRAGQYEAAISEYQSGRTKLGGTPFTQELADAYEAAGDFPKALEHVQELLKNWPSDVTRPKVESRKKALEVAADGQLEQAAKIYDGLLTKAENWERPLIQYRLEAMKARAEGRTPPPPSYLASSQGAQIKSEQIMVIVPKGEEPLSQRQLGKNIYQTTTPNQRTALVETWEPATKAQQLIKEGLLLEAKGDYQEAARFYEKAPAIPDADETVKGNVHLGLQRCYEKLGDVEKEKAELLWLKENIFKSGARYAFLRDNLTEENRTRLQERIGQITGQKP